MHRESSTYLVNICLHISSRSIDGIKQLVVQIAILDTILMGYCMAGQVRIMMSSVLYKIKLSIEGNNL